MVDQNRSESDKIDQNLSSLEKSIIKCTKSSEKNLNFSEISKRTGIDRKVVSGLAKELENRGILEIEEIGPSKVPRLRDG